MPTYSEKVIHNAWQSDIYRLYCIKMNEEMKNMKEAFEEFSTLCDNVTKSCNEFRAMDINKKPTRTNYDEMWGVSGYYNDNDGNDIRDRD